jgi:hypothetical protein
MKDFNPAGPAIVHDRVSDSIVSWTGEDAAEFHSLEGRPRGRHDSMEVLRI